MVKDIQEFHIQHRQWKDIGYNFLVAPTGDVFEGRGWGVVGSHAPKYNSKSVGICLIGDYLRELCTQENFITNLEQALNMQRWLHLRLKVWDEETQSHLIKSTKIPLQSICPYKSTKSTGKNIYCK